MKQLVQNLKTGKMELLEVPYPALGKGMILVRNYYSLISAGTEGSKVETARKGYIAKAKEKPEALRQVLDSIKTEGIIPTYHKVMNKLDAPAPLGYSCSGKIIGLGPDIKNFKIGDNVACGGTSADHAEVVAVPENLCAKVPDHVELELAAYTTVASIAMQGVRQASLQLGETCVVIGLGLVGQLIVQFLKASGVRVVGVDVNGKAVDLAYQSGADLALSRNDATLENRISEFSNGYGTDAVIISAGTHSLDPIELAGKICRKKGKVIIVGAVPTGFSRENYYKKELSLLMSCSYGPGRYDINYEEKGIDYPIAYSRWTENRNMQAFLNMVAENKIHPSLLTTHIFPFIEAMKAYNMIVEKSEHYVGIILKYNIEDQPIQTIHLSPKTKLNSEFPQVGFIGAGSFAQKFLLPNVNKKANFIGVSTANGNNARNVADKYGFQYATGDYKDLCDDKNINTIFIATRHNLHCEQVLEALKHNKHVFVEKPLCLHEEELENIINEYEKHQVRLMVGFNRRFAPEVEKIVQLMGKNTVKTINYRINAGKIPSDNWIQDQEIGGGRIIGEVCHFIDLAMYIAGSKISSLSAFAINNTESLPDTLTINLMFSNQSIANITYLANGSKALKKEYLEVHSNGLSAIIDDFKTLSIYGKRCSKSKLLNQNKGHAREIELFIESIKKGLPQPISFNDIYLSTLATFKVVESIKTGKVIFL